MRYFFLSISLIILLIGCSDYKTIEVISENQNSRIDYVVIHATSQDFDESLETLTKDSDYPVSSHYLIPESARKDTNNYFGKELPVYRLVDEHRRAWHAGVSSWRDEVSLNDRSIGIEVVNEFNCEYTNDKNTDKSVDEIACQFLPFPADQIDLLKLLLIDILERYPRIDPVDIVAHSDIAPDRKSDPGPYFPWKELYDIGIGAWYDMDTYDKYFQIFGTNLPDIESIQSALRVYGYPVEITGINDQQTKFGVRAFQLHFRPSNFSGDMDQESLAILFALIEKYRKQELNAFSGILNIV